MRNVLMYGGLMILSYLMGSIPWGYILTKAYSGQDIRRIESGRTGGTNTMRATNFWLGFVTSILDILKSASAVWIAKALTPGQTWLHILSPVMVIIGHNYSVYLIEREADGRVRTHGGAGGAPATGGAIGLWWPSVFFLVPLGILIVFGIGYASIATLSLPLIAGALFLYRTLWFGSPWEYILFALLAELLIVWSLRPNIRRLLRGDERVVGWRAKGKETREQ